MAPLHLSPDERATDTGKRSCLTPSSPSERLYTMQNVQCYVDTSEESHPPSAHYKGARNACFVCGRVLCGLLVLGGDTLKRDDEIFEGTLLLVLLGRLSVHKVVEANAVLQKVIDTSHNAEDTE